MTKIKQIEKFIRILANTKPTNDSVNPWQYNENKGNDIRRKNLKEYLLTLSRYRPTILLLGEAPGYRGTCRTGVPFCSEKIILTNPFYTAKKNFSIEISEKVIGESSSSIVWKTLDELKFYPLLWASFPFHPHQMGNNLSNRAPTKEELALGQTFIKSLIKIFEIQTIIAIGRAAERALNELNIPIAAQVRHPSHGGAKQFRDGLRSFLMKNRFIKHTLK